MFFLALRELFIMFFNLTKSSYMYLKTLYNYNVMDTNDISSHCQLDYEQLVKLANKGFPHFG